MGVTFGVNAAATNARPFAPQSGSVIEKGPVLRAAPKVPMRLTAPTRGDIRYPGQRRAPSARAPPSPDHPVSTAYNVPRTEKWWAIRAAARASAMPSAAAPSNCSPHPLTAAPKSTAHHTGAERLYSTVIEPAVDTNPAQHHLSSFASQFVGIAFMGRRRRGAYNFGRRFSGFGHLETSPSQQILEEGLGCLILAWRGRRPDGKRGARNLKALGLGGGIDHDGRDTEAILGYGKLHCWQRLRFARACRKGCDARGRMRRSHRHRRRQNAVADEPAPQRRL